MFVFIRAISGKSSLCLTGGDIPFVSQGEFGDILLSLCYQPNAAKLTVLVLKCRNLVAEDLNGYSGKAGTFRRTKCAGHVTCQ